MSFSFDTEIAGIRQKNLYRFLRTVESDQAAEISFEGRKILNFSSNNYLGLANHPLLKKAATQATEKYGTGSGASRLITGSMTLHNELEETLARFKGTEAALVFNSGYHANLGVISTLVGEGDEIFSDELNHASLIDGCRLSKAHLNVYRHGDVACLEELLAGTKASKKLILTDSVFSMDGDLAPLKEILALAEKYDAMVFVDEAHGTGVFGKTGRGVVEHFGIDSRHPRLIQMGTLGKALGSFGAYVAGSKSLIELLVNKSRTFIFTTSLPPAVLAASKAAVELISRDDSFRKKLWENIEYFMDRGSWIVDRQIQRSAIHDLRSTMSPIIPLIIGDSGKTMEAAQKLFDQGIWATGIRPPTVPEGTSRIRLTLMASHTREQLDRCLGEIGEIHKI